MSKFVGEAAITQRTLATIIIASVILAGCATAARYTLQDRFRAIGIPAGASDCMVDELEQRLSGEDLQDLARYTLRLSRADSTIAAVRSLMEIENPRAVTAVGRSAISCVTGFSL